MVHLYNMDKNKFEPQTYEFKTLEGKHAKKW